MPASQDFRDGAAYGAALLVSRIVKLQGWGITPDHGHLHEMAEGIRSEFGGATPKGIDTSEH